MRALPLALLMLALAAAPVRAVLPEDRVEGDTATAAQWEAAVEAWGAMDWPAMTERLEAILRVRPFHADALTLMGYGARRMDDPARALAYYARALAVEPAHRGALAYQGVAWLRTGDRASAEANLARLRDACPEGCAALDALAEALDHHAMTGETLERCPEDAPPFD